MKFKIEVIRFTETDWEVYEDHLKPLFVTEAVSDKKAINNIRYRVNKELGWRNHDESNGSVSVRYEFRILERIENNGFEQLSIFDFGDDC